MAIRAQQSPICRTLPRSTTEDDPGGALPAVVQARLGACCMAYASVPGLKFNHSNPGEAATSYPPTNQNK